MSVQTIVTYVSLQQTDLHCVSAFEAIRYSLSCDRIKQLRRFKCLTFLVDSPSESTAIELVNDSIRRAFDIVNPNKETVHIASLPDLVGDGWVRMDVTAIDPYLRRITSPNLTAFPQIKGVESHVMWALQIDSFMGDSDIKMVLNTCGPAISSRQGLLCNPMFETVSIGPVR